MNNKILKLVYDYSSKKKPMDKAFIDKIVEIYVNEKELDDYVSDVSFTNKFEKNDESVTCACYDRISSSITVDHESIILLIKSYNIYSDLFNDLEKTMLAYLITSQIILHELEHANQEKISDKRIINSDEEKLIFTCGILSRAMKNPNLSSLLDKIGVSAEEFIIYKKLSWERYKKLYKFNPIERLAEAYSNKTILDAIEPINRYIPNLFEFEKALLVEDLLSGYSESMKNGICPTQLFLYGVNQGKIWEGFDFYTPDEETLMKKVSKKYDLTKRLTLGFPVSFQEYEASKEWLKSTNKYCFY